MFDKLRHLVTGHDPIDAKQIAEEAQGVHEDRGAEVAGVKERPKTDPKTGKVAPPTGPEEQS